MQTNATHLLLSWYDANKRSLPWRGISDPYRVWVSEIMLQQTRVEAARGYYARFLDAFPDAEALAASRLEDVYKLWEGLGYYSRARRLREAAKAIVEAGGFPKNRAGWLALPGVGPYTAAAIASICFGEAVCAVDGNVLRVAARCGGIREPIETPSARRAAEAFASRLLDRARPGDSNQALIELGATLCAPRAPECAACPLAGGCDARSAGDAELLPVRAPKREKREERLNVAVILHEGAVLVRKRPDEGLLAGWWEFPHGLSAAQLKKFGAARTAELAPAKHIFTHRIWRMEAALYRAARRADLGEGYLWAARDELNMLHIPSAMAPWLEAALEVLE